MIRLSYIFDEQTFIDANHALWLRKRREPKSRLFGWIFLAALPVAVWLAISRGMYFILLAVLAANALHWLFDWPLTRAIARRKFRQLPNAGQRIEWEIDANKLKVTAGGESGDISWNALTDAYEADGGFILAQPHNVMHWLPKTAFSSEKEIEQMRHWIAQRAQAGPDE